MKAVSLALLSSWLCGKESPELCWSLSYSVGLRVEFQTETPASWHGMDYATVDVSWLCTHLKLHFQRDICPCRLNTGPLLRWTGSLKARASKQSKPNTAMSKADKGFPTSIVYFVNEWDSSTMERQRNSRDAKALGVKKKRTAQSNKWFSLWELVVTRKIKFQKEWQKKNTTGKLEKERRMHWLAQRMMPDSGAVLIGWELWSHLKEGLLQFVDTESSVSVWRGVKPTMTSRTCFSHELSLQRVLAFSAYIPEAFLILVSTLKTEGLIQYESKRCGKIIQFEKVVLTKM